MMIRARGPFRVVLGCFALLVAAACRPPEPIPEAFVGVFHLEGLVDAHNLEIREDGRVRWITEGCDFMSSGEDQVEADGNQLVVIDEKSPPTLRLSDSFDGIIADPPLRARQSGTPEHWYRGGICAECGGNLGPTGLAACADPFANYPK